MTWQILSTSSNFWSNGIWLSQAQLIATIIVWFLALRLAWYLWKKQIKLANKQLSISSIWNKVNWLTAEIAIWQSKLEHMVSVWTEATNLTKEQMDEFMSWIEWIKKSLDDLYKSRSETLDMYDKEIIKK